MDPYPVRVGSMLYTMVDPNPGHEVAYNRWYERDHFYAGCMIGPWLFAGGRWVAPRELKDLRIPDPSPIAGRGRGSFLSIYWIHADHHDEHTDWAGEQVHWLYDNGRGFAERTHIHTALYDYRSTVYRDADGIPIELALDHRFAGMFNVFLERADGVDDAALDTWLEGEALPKLLAGSAIACASTWTPHTTEGSPAQNAPMDLGSGPGGPERRMQLLFSDAEPRQDWERIVTYARDVDASGLAKVLFATPFFPTVVGTDTYCDQLW